MPLSTYISAKLIVTRAQMLLKLKNRTKSGKINYLTLAWLASVDL